jgi:hypothetical protein
MTTGTGKDLEGSTGGLIYSTIPACLKIPGKITQKSHSE